MTTSFAGADGPRTAEPSHEGIECGDAVGSSLGDIHPLPLRVALWAVLRSVLTTIRLLSSGRIHQPRDSVGDVLHFADGSSAVVYRETVVDRESVIEPVALVVSFRLRWVRGKGHALFRAESLLNTPLFVGFRGLESKLWLAHDENATYRGVYQWDGPEFAHQYARALWWILRLVCERRSIHYTVIAGRTRDQLLAARGSGDGEWWRVVAVDRAHARRR